MIVINMCTGTMIKHVYWGVQGACPRQAVTSAEGTAERQRVPCHRHRSKACLEIILKSHVTSSLSDLCLHNVVNQFIIVFSSMITPHFLISFV